MEHIFPQNPCDAAVEEFGEFLDPGIANMLGNLVLVEKPINASLGNREYSHKKTVYPQSNLLMTKAISEIPAIGVNTKIDQAVAQFKPYDEWNEGAILSRQAMLGELAREVWRVPSPA